MTSWRLKEIIRPCDVTDGSSCFVSITSSHSDNRNHLLEEIGDLQIGPDNTRDTGSLMGRFPRPIGERRRPPSIDRRGDSNLLRQCFHSDANFLILFRANLLYDGRYLFCCCSRISGVYCYISIAGIYGLLPLLFIQREGLSTTR